MTSDPSPLTPKEDREVISSVASQFEASWRSTRSTLLPTLQESTCKDLIDRLLCVDVTRPLCQLETKADGSSPDMTHLAVGVSTSKDAIDRLGPYRLTRVIGTGGMSTVYEAQDERLGRLVAVKIHSGLRLDQTSQTRFAREAQTQARVNHSAILPIYDVSVTPAGIPYLVTELAKAGTWRDYLLGIFSEDKSHENARFEKANNPSVNRPDRRWTICCSCCRSRTSRY